MKVIYNILLIAYEQPYEHNSVRLIPPTNTKHKNPDSPEDYYHPQDLNKESCQAVASGYISS